MPVLRLRITGGRNAVDSILAQLHGIDKIDRLEEVDDEISDMRDDSSSADSPDDNPGSDVHRIELHTTDAASREQIHDAIEIAARDLDAAVEFVDRF